MKIQDVMTRSVESCGPGDAVADIGLAMWRRDCGIVPVLDHDRRVLGVITDRDVCIAVATRRPAHGLIANDIMSTPAHVARGDDGVHVALQTMREQRVRRLPVVDAEGRVQGIVSIDDIILRVQLDATPGGRGVSPHDVVRTLQVLCEPRGERPAPTPREPAGGAQRTGGNR